MVYPAAEEREDVGVVPLTTLQLVISLIAGEKVVAVPAIDKIVPIAAGYKVVAQGDNGFVCIVMRGWAAPTFTPAPFRDLVYYAKLRAPICFNPAASRTVLPLQELRARLGMEGKTPDQIAEGIQAAYAKGELPKMETVAFAYMFSADQDLGPGAGAWHPHMMLYTPYYENSMLGGNQVGGALPFVGDDAGTPFAVTVIPVAHELAVKAQGK